MKVNLTLENKEKLSESEFLKLLRIFIHAGNTYALTEFHVVKWEVVK